MFCDNKLQSLWGVCYNSSMKSLQVVGAIFIKEGKVFAAKRGDSRYPYVAHKYEFVGGKVEPGESCPEALARELREEMTLDATVLAPYVTVRHTYPDFVVTLHVYLCEMTSPYRLLEHEGAAWLSPDQLHPEEWAPADAPIVERLKYDLERGDL